MTAFRLAAYVEHTLDVPGMLNKIDAGLYEWWLAYDQIEPIGVQQLTYTLSLIGAAITQHHVDPALFLYGAEKQ